MATRSTGADSNETARSGQGLLTIGLSDRHVPGTGSPLRWFFSGVWLVYLIQPVSDLFQHDHGVAWIAGGLVITVAFCVIYLPVLMFSDTRPRLALYGLGALVALAAVACVVYGKNWVPLWIYVSAAGGMVLTSVYDRRRASLGVFAIAACYLLFCWITHFDAASTLAILLPVLLIGLAMIGFRLQMTLLRQAGPGSRDGRQAGRERGTAPAGPGHARPDRAVAVDDHAEVRAGRQAPDQAAVLGRTRLGAHRTRRHRPGQPADAARHQGGGQRLPQAHARHRGHHGAQRAGGGRHRARRRRRADPALGHLRPGRRGGCWPGACARPSPT